MDIAWHFLFITFIFLFQKNKKKSDQILKEMESYQVTDDLDNISLDLNTDLLPDLDISMPDINICDNFPPIACDNSIVINAKDSSNDEYIHEYTKYISREHTKYLSDKHVKYMPDEVFRYTPDADCEKHPTDEQDVVLPINNFINTIFFCIVCNVAFTTETDLENHNNEVHTAIAPLINSEIRNCIQRETEMEEREAEKIISQPKYISSDKKEIKCEKCLKVFQKISNYKLHITEHPKCYVKQYFCTVCHEAFASIHELREHLELHKKETLFRCEQCHKPFTTAQYLKFHIVSQHQKPFRCEFCEMTFGYRHYLSSHLDTKHDGHGRECRCQVCSKHFQSVRRPKKKSKITKEQEHVSYKCSTCTKEFPNAKDLEMHSILKHRREYCCYICHQNYATFNQVKRHLRYHNEREEMLCNTCGKQIKGKSAFKIHLRTHSGEKPFLCMVCNRNFTRQSDLNSHMFTHNEDKKAHQCNLCGKQFAKPYQIKIHMMVHRDERPYQCDVCNKKFRFYDKLKGHLRTHNGIKAYVCAICNEDFRKKNEFQQHMKLHHDP